MPPSALRPYSMDAYGELMSGLLAEGFVFSRFTDPPPADRRAIYLRHDVDYSLELALTLAEANAALGIRGTFFVQVRAELYNVFAPSGAGRVHQIRSLGQGIALHHVGRATETGVNEVSEIQRDFELLGLVEPVLDPAFSWHRPTTTNLLDGPELQVPGLVNTYGQRFFREMPYLSDSTHRASVDELEAALAATDASELHLLLHPVNWVGGGSSGVEILIRGWVRVLRDHERTLLENRAYAERFPKGMPQRLLRDLEEGLLGSASTDPTI